MGNGVKWWLVVALAVTLPSSPAAAQEAVARSSVNQTAMWVADPLVYTVEITCAPGIDVLEDDLAQDKLKLEGLEFVSLETLRDVGPGETTIRTFRYHLTTYKADQATLKIGDLTARYYRVRPGQGIENAAAAGDVKIPGAIVAFRSMMPDEQESYVLRDRRPSANRLRALGLARPIGTGLIVASAVPVVLWAVALISARRPRKERRSIRQVRREERTSIGAVRAIDLSSEGGRREAYTKINALVRDHLRDVHDVPGPSLTTPEIEPALASRSPRVPPETIRALLAECDAARYAPPDKLPSAEACRAAIDQAAQLLGTR